MQALINVAITIIAILIIILIIKIISRKKNKTKMKKEFQIIERKYDEVKTVEDEIDDSLKRMAQICNTSDSIELLQIWKKEYVQESEIIIDLSEYHTQIIEAKELNKYKEFKKSTYAFNEKYDGEFGKIKDIHDRLLTYTSYEIKNTEIAIELKKNLKIINNEVLIKFVDHKERIVIERFLTKCNDKLQEFEDKQKNGRYKEARETLKLINMDLNRFTLENDMLEYLVSSYNQIKREIEQIVEAKKEIEKIGYKLQIDDELEGLKKMQEYIVLLEERIINFTFFDERNDKLFEHDKKLIELNTKITLSIKEELFKEYENIKDLIDIMKEVEVLALKCENIFKEAKKEYVEINKYYEIKELERINILNEEIKNYETFKEDYRKLLELIEKSKDYYDTLIDKLEDSKQYLYKILDKLKKMMNDIKAIREDEILIRETINHNQKELALISLYLRNNNHYYDMSSNLEHSLEECYKKMDQLVQELESNPLNIETVRMNNKTVETLKKQMILRSETEMKQKEAIRILIKYVNKFIVNDERETLVSHINYLYNNREYTNSLKEIKNIIEIENGNDDVYKEGVSKVKIKTFDEYAKALA